MNLCDRLQRPAPMGYGRRYLFKYRGHEYFGKQILVWNVVERYSMRFGALSVDRAELLYIRLAKKYSYGPGVEVILRALTYRYETPSYEDIFTVYAHPASAAKNSFKMKCARKLVSDATKYADGSYGFINHHSDRTCRLCGGRIEYTLYTPHMAGLVNVFQSIKGTYGICRNAMCKALVQVFPQCKSDRKKLPMAYVLMELTKNGDRSGKVREIEEIASRDIYKTHNRRNLQKAGKSSSRAGATV